jgi:hypothetical protein
VINQLTDCGVALGEPDHESRGTPQAKTLKEPTAQTRRRHATRALREKSVRTKQRGTLGAENERVRCSNCCALTRNEARWHAAWPRAARDTRSSTARKPGRGYASTAVPWRESQRWKTGNEPTRTKRKTGGFCFELKNRIKNQQPAHFARLVTPKPSHGTAARCAKKSRRTETQHAAAHTSRGRTESSKGAPAGEKPRRGENIERGRRRKGRTLPKTGFAYLG